MSNKKRRLSPSASSRSSSTPVPALPAPQTFSLSARSPRTDEFPAPLSVRGPSRRSASATPTPASIPVKEERTITKQATLVPGSGDGTKHGDECFLWTDLPMNKQGYRYALCAPSLNPSPSPLHPFYRTLNAPPPTPPVHISWLDRSQYLRIDPIAMTASTDRGYRSARANVAVRSGSWYYEVQILRGSGLLGAGGGTGGDAGNAHVRVGWGRREANLDAPVGMDGYSYAIRDVRGEKVHLSRSTPYGLAFGSGNVVGCLITLPSRQEALSVIRRKRVALRYKGQLYFESEEYTTQKEMEALVDREGKAATAAKAEAEAAKDIGDVKGKKGATTKNAKKAKSTSEPSGPMSRSLPILEDSSIEFFLDGESLGTAFTELHDFTPLPSVVTKPTPGKRYDSKETVQDDGTLGYYPMISCFGKGKVKLNFGPPWQYPPPGSSARGMTERWEEFREEEKVLDERDEAESRARLIKEMKEDVMRRKAAEARLALVGAGTLKRKAHGAWKPRKSGNKTPTPSVAVTPGPDAVSTLAIERTPTRMPKTVEGEVVRVKMEMEVDGTAMSGREATDPLRAGSELMEAKDEVEEAEDEVEEANGAEAGVGGAIMSPAVYGGDAEDAEEGVQW